MAVASSLRGIGKRIRGFTQELACGLKVQKRILHVLHHRTHVLILVDCVDSLPSAHILQGLLATASEPPPQLDQSPRSR